MTRVHWIRTTRANWLKWRKETESKQGRYLEDRIVFCANCETNRNLASASGKFTCSACGSENWMFLSSAIVARFKDYDEDAVRKKLSVQRSVKPLKKELFFAANTALV